MQLRHHKLANVNSDATFNHFLLGMYPTTVVPLYIARTIYSQNNLVIHTCQPFVTIPITNSIAVLSQRSIVFDDKSASLNQPHCKHAWYPLIKELIAKDLTSDSIARVTYT